MRFRSAALAALLLALIPAAADAQRRPRPPASVTYVAASGPPGPGLGGAPFQLAAVTIQGGTLVTRAIWVTQPFVGYGEVTSASPGELTTTAIRNVRLSRKGTFTIPIPLSGGSTPSTQATPPGTSSVSSAGGCLTGTLKGNRLSLSGYASSNGGGSGAQSSCSITSFYGTPLTVSTLRGEVEIPSGTYTGSTTGNQQSDPDGLYGPTTGPVGTLSLTVGEGSIAGGTGSFSPQDPTTGATTSGAQIPVTYGSTEVDPLTGGFQLPSTPSGYDLCGALLPGGTLGGLAQCEQSSWLPASFSLTSSGTPGF